MDEMTFERAAVIGAGGPTGAYLTAALLDRGCRVRVVGRHRDRLEEAFSDRDVEVAAADAADPAATLEAVAGCDLVADCIGLGPEQMHLHPITAANIADAVRATGARCIHVSSFWAYLPIRRLPLDERHPRSGGVEYVELRRAAEDVLEQAGAAVVNLPDFYGPRVHSSTLQQPLTEAVAGGPMNWIGKAGTPREYAFIPDAMRTVAALAARREAYGERWIVPGAGPLTGDDVERIVSEHLGRRVKLRAAGPTMLRLVSWFSRPLRQFMPMVPYYVEPISYDGSKLRALLGEPGVTSYRDGIAATLDWLRQTG